MVKLADIAEVGEGRTIESIKDAKLEYNNLTIKVKVVKLTGGQEGMINVDRFPDMRKELTEDADGNAVLPENWRLGAARNGNSLGFWTNLGRSGGTLTLD